MSVTICFIKDDYVNYVISILKILHLSTQLHMKQRTITPSLFLILSYYEWVNYNNKSFQKTQTYWFTHSLTVI